MCARIVVVDVPKEVQVERTAERDEVSTDQVEQMVSAQMEREKRLEKADDVLVNTGTIEELEKKVEELHEKYLQMVE
jgi:dephospho-CoA kinase